MTKPMYVLNDYSADIDLWLRDDSMCRNQYAHYRLWGVRHMHYWWAAASMTYLGIAVYEGIAAISRV